MELTIMLLILSAMMIAVIMLSGLEISSNNILLKARTEAQRSSLADDATPVLRERELRSWNYQRLNFEKPGKQFGGTVPKPLLKKGNSQYRMRVSTSGSLYIPFSYQNSQIINTDADTLQSATTGMTSMLYTQPRLSLYDQYMLGEWRELSGFDTGLKGDFTRNITSNAFNIANLVMATDSSSSAPVTINKRDQATPRSSDNAAGQMFCTFREMFGVDLNKLNFNDNDTNKVYMPVH